MRYHSSLIMSGSSPLPWAQVVYALPSGTDLCSSSSDRAPCYLLLASRVRIHHADHIKEQRSIGGYLSKKELEMNWS